MDDSVTRPWRPPGPSGPELAMGAAAGAAARLAAPLFAAFVREAMSHLVELGPDRRTRTEPAEPGWFGRTSVAWQVHADTSMLVAGLAAFALQALHPRALAGVADHSSFGRDFFGRTKRTGAYVIAVTYGTSQEAAAACQTVKRIHERVVGHTPDGRPYRASEPELLHWIHTAQYAATAAAYCRFAAHPLTDAELDRYVAEVARVGEEMEVPDPPRSWVELTAALERHRPYLAVGEQARGALQFLAEPPGLPWAIRPAWSALFAGAVASLPPFAQRLIGLPRPTMPEVAACRALVRATAATLAQGAVIDRMRGQLATVLNRVVLRAADEDPALSVERR